ncbi:serine hydrolase [Polaribacter sp. Hel_I_88]|uniref:serine hydrolase domain-containing protein n=1 Tax=Polaribacter sp. Hel_I_88 TaxID=1250006 RepID=UPI000A40DB0C|nr:serine hydrolase domain-containing protein [Polaribacter sp. Hel_I_88]
MINSRKKIILLTLVVFSTLFFAFISFNAEIEEQPQPEKPIAEEESILPISLEYFPETVVKKVNSKLDSLLKRINKRHDFHGAVLVAKKGKIVYSNQVGFADFRKKIPLKNESIFQLASVSKQFTAAAIMQLKEQHKIKLADTINVYLPDFPYKNITIANLLNHTSGLPKYFWVAEHEWKEKNAPSNADLMKILPFSKAQRFFKPGRNFDYSNTGYFVLASIVEKVSGVSFGEYLHKNIFEPLDMQNSFVYSYQNDTVRRNQLIGYRLYRGWKHIKIGNTVNDAIVGDKNVYSNAEDLYKWTVALNSGEFLNKESIALMYTPGKTIYGRKVPYGFGFRMDKLKEDYVYHYGKWNGFSTALTNYINDDVIVIILEHTSYNSLRYLNRKVKEIVNNNLDV